MKAWPFRQITHCTVSQTSPSFTVTREIVRKFLLMLFHLLLSERDRAVSRGGAERERGREGDIEPEAGSRLRAVSTEPDAGLERMDLEIMT